MKLLEMLSLDVLERACVVAGAVGLERKVRWVHLVDLPDLLPWVRAGQFLSPVVRYSTSFRGKCTPGQVVPFLLVPAATRDREKRGNYYVRGITTHTAH